jgi:hypothetical protein
MKRREERNMRREREGDTWKGWRERDRERERGGEREGEREKQKLELERSFSEGIKT